MKKILTIPAFVPLLFLSITLNAQITTASQWTWMKGDSTNNTRGVYGTKGIAAASNRPGARQASSTWKDASGNLWLFGGRGNDAVSPIGMIRPLNDLWKYNIATNEWTWVSGDSVAEKHGVYGVMGVANPANKPGARRVSASWTDAAGNFWLFGGNGFAASGGGSDFGLNDLWKYSSVTNQWTWVKGDSIIHAPGVYGTQGLAATANKPGCRYLSATWIDNAGNLFLFGGQGYYGDYNDLWKYNPATNQWAWLKGDTLSYEYGVYGVRGMANAANKPGARVGSFASKGTDGNFWLFGGQGYNSDNYGYLNDLWKYNPTTNQWAWMNGDSLTDQKGVYGVQGVAATANKPGGRGSGQQWTDATGNFWLFGGDGYAASGNGLMNDLWKYDILTNQWTWVKGDSITNQPGIYGNIGTTGAANKPGARLYGVTWTDASGNFWLFGGRNSNTLNDLWKLSNPTTLPVTLSSIKAYQQNSHITVEWKVQNEIGIKHYEVEKSTDDNLFTKTTVQPATGNRTSTVNYAWVDINPVTGNNFYRIRSVGLDGEVKYSQVVKVTIGKGQPRYEVYPNPVSNGTIQLQFINQPKGMYEVRLLNSLGQVLLTRKIAHEAGSSTETIQINSQTMRGPYTLIVMGPHNNWKAIKII